MSTKTIITSVSIVLLSIVVVTGISLAAGTSSVAIQPDSETIQPGDTTTIDIVVTDVSGGVGSFDLAVAIGDRPVADITDTTVYGNASTVETNGDDERVRIAATGLNTTDSGSVTVASVTLSGETAGTTSLNLSVSAVGDESGSSYDIESPSNGQLTVESPSTPTPTPTPTSTPTPTATPTPTPTPTPPPGGGGGGLGGDSTDEPTTTSTPTATSTPVETSTPTSTPVSTTAPVDTPTESATPTGTATESTEPPATDATGGSGPGFGMGVALIAIAAVALVSLRRVA